MEGAESGPKLTRQLVVFADATFSVAILVGLAGGGGVLMSQQKSLVFYGVHVNDVYGYFLTGQKNGALSETEIGFTGARVGFSRSDGAHSRKSR